MSFLIFTWNANGKEVEPDFLHHFTSRVEVNQPSLVAFCSQEDPSLTVQEQIQEEMIFLNYHLVFREEAFLDSYLITSIYALYPEEVGQFKYSIHQRKSLLGVSSRREGCLTVSFDFLYRSILLSNMKGTLCLDSLEEPNEETVFIVGTFLLTPQQSQKTSFLEGVEGRGREFPPTCNLSPFREGEVNDLLRPLNREREVLPSSVITKNFLTSKSSWCEHILHSPDLETVFYSRIDDPTTSMKYFTSAAVAGLYLFPLIGRKRSYAFTFPHPEISSRDIRVSRTSKPTKRFWQNRSSFNSIM